MLDKFEVVTNQFGDVDMRFNELNPIRDEIKKLEKSKATYNMVNLLDFENK